MEELDTRRDKPLSPEKFKSLMDCERQVKYDRMVERYKAEKAALDRETETAIAEYTFIDRIVKTNSLLLAENGNSELIGQTEMAIAGLNPENLQEGLNLREWERKMGSRFISIMSDIMCYFFDQMLVKDKLTGAQVIQLAVKITATHPLLKLRELIYVFNQALTGAYGPSYQRIGIDTILCWLKIYLNQSCERLEAQHDASKPEGARGDRPWIELENKMKRYEAEQREKQRINEKVYGIEKRKAEVEEYKSKLKR